MIPSTFRNRHGIEFVWVPSGSFLMGACDADPDADENERPPHQASVERGFFMARTPVSLRQYRRFAKYEPREFGAWADAHAVNFISCAEADRWVAALNAGRTSDERVTYRLPTEAEWEYACRSGSTTRFFYGDDPHFADLGAYAWFAGNTWDVGAKHPHPVGQKTPNAFGLHDMHGNVWEWTSDGWALYGDIIERGEAARDPTLRVLRGGGWCHEGRYHRASDRDYYEPGYRHYYTGFRVCCDPDREPDARSRRE